MHFKNIIAFLFNFIKSTNKINSQNIVQIQNLLTHQTK